MKKRLSFVTMLLSMCFYGLILLVVDVSIYWQAANATALAV
jgi:hypothetical protein